MAVKIRLRRTGAKHQPSYRLVVADSASPRDGRYVEVIGHYNPRRHDDSGQPELRVNIERALYWLDSGAQPTDTARSLLRKARVLELKHDRDHGLDITERVAAMTAPVAAPEPVAAPVKEKPKRTRKSAPKAEAAPAEAAGAADETAGEG